MSFGTFDEAGDFPPMVDHLYATLHRLDAILALLPPALLVSRASRLNRMAEQWGASFGHGISDELADFAARWNDRAARAGGGTDASSAEDCEAGALHRHHDGRGVPPVSAAARRGSRAYFSPSFGAGGTCPPKGQAAAPCGQGTGGDK